jgi:hypothetical protein
MKPPPRPITERLMAGDAQSGIETDASRKRSHADDLRLDLPRDAQKPLAGRRDGLLSSPSISCGSYG